MRNATLLAGAIAALGLGAAATLAMDSPEDSSLYGRSASGAVVVITKAKIDGVGKVWARCSADAAELGVDSYVTSTLAVVHVSGWMSQKIKGGDGAVTSTQSLGFALPIPKLGDRKGKVKNDVESLVESPFVWDLERFVNGSLVTDTAMIDPWDPWEPPDDPPIIVLANKRRPSKVTLGGALALSTVSSKGQVKTNRHVEKLKAKVVLKFEGYVVNGPHAGHRVKGSVKVKYKGAVDD